LAPKYAFLMPDTCPKQRKPHELRKEAVFDDAFHQKIHLLAKKTYLRSKNATKT
jgi:hypothetical protein